MKNREYKKLLAAALMVAMVGSMIHTTTYNSHAQETPTVTTQAADTAERDLVNTIKESTSSSKNTTAVPTKDETVYAKVDASGSVQSVTVSDQLKNVTDETKITDVSMLKDIENVKGDETFSRNSNKLTWNGDGADIVYQGTTTVSLPVGVKVMYTLDGREISADELKGKSGHLKIRYEYMNMTGSTAANFTPFLMATGVVIDTDMFNNVTVKNGKISSDGDRDLVIGMGLPRVKAELGADDLDIPDYFEMEADVTDYKAPEAVTIATNEIFNQLDTNGFSSLDDLKASMMKLGDASRQLVEGSGTLSNGTRTLRSGADTLAAGTKTLAAGADTLLAGTSSLAEGSETLAAGNASLADGLKQMKEQTAELPAQTTVLVEGLRTAEESTSASNTEGLSAGAGTLDAGAGVLQSGIKTVGSGIASLNAGFAGTQVANGAPGLVEGSTALKDGAAKLASGAAVAAAGTSELAEGSVTLASGIQSAGTVVGQLETGAENLGAGMGMVKTYTQMVLEDYGYIAPAASQLAASAQNVADEASSLEDVSDLTESAEAVKNSAGEAAGQAAAAADSANSASTSVQEAQTAVDSVGNDTSGTDNALGVLYSISGSEEIPEDVQAAINEAIGNLESQQAADAATNDALACASASMVNAQTGVDATAASAEALGAAAGNVQEQAAALQTLAPDVHVDAQQLSEDAAVLGETMTATQQHVMALQTYETAVSDGLNGDGAENPGLIAGLQGLQAGFDGEDGLVNGANKITVGLNGNGTAAYPGLKAGTAAISDGLNAPGAGLKDGAATLNTGILRAADGVAQLNAGVNTGTAATDSLVAGAAKLKAGSSQLFTGVQTLDAGLVKLYAGSQQLADGSVTLVKGISAAKDGADQAASGAASAADGAGQVNDGTASLNTGLRTLQSGTGALVDGVQKLDDGADTLNKGMIEFDETGIQKLTKAFDGDIDGMLNKLNTMLDASKQYKSFSGISNDMDGSVKFIFISDADTK
ncbi:autotransporter outer membrane beta-barrel domain-containing protein [Hespellia stercorisuis]|uniref:Putative membrane protein n=1 Tax=Hespellia stercorisuis DSM 15480 TaxID=1121950 RepID=A0A1M6HQY2_9FIRM|nr:hypothetical protein [Hespellia stercorisuis]SHJ24632.1 putative membrane protein [Hespellia stercorisuis DSM 15480]